MPRTVRLLLCCFLCLLPWAAASAQETAEGPDALVARYLDLVVRGDLDGARSLWSPSYLAASGQLGIVYPDAILPFDMASPLLLHLAAVREGAARVEVAAATAVAGHFEVAVRLEDAGAGPPHRYAVVRDEGAWRLANPIWAATRDWPRVSTRYFTLLTRDASLLAPPAIASLDAFVDSMATQFAITAPRLAHLRDVKIPYVLADSPTVERLTGYATKGMGDLSAGLLISSHFPHYHEAAHLLVNYALEAAPLHPLPALQEGLASLAGGRWGKSPGVVLHMGWANAEMGFASVADLLTRDGFHGATGGANAAYPAAALLCDLIVAEAGWPAVLELQRTLAEVPGSPRTSEAIAAVIGRTCGWPSGQPLATLTALWEHRRQAYSRAGVAPAAWPGDFIPAGDGVAVHAVGDDLVFSVVAGDGVRGVLPEGGGGPRTPASALFGELFPGRPYAGEHVGIRCSAGSVSVYDFTTNRIVGVWVGDFAGESGALAAPGGRLVFKVRRGLLVGSEGWSWSVFDP